MHFICQNLILFNAITDLARSDNIVPVIIARVGKRNYVIPRYFCVFTIKRSSAVITLIILRVKNKLLISL